MKFFTVILGLLLVACQPQPPTRIPVAPTVLAPPKAKPVDLEPVRRDLGPVTESNRQLHEQIITGKRSIYELNQKLKNLESNRAATAEEWARLTTLGKATEQALGESEKVNAEQRKAIDSLERTVSLKAAEVAVADAQRAAVDAALEEANLRITGLTTAQQDAAAAAASAEARVAAEKSTAAGERKWKWIFIGSTGFLTLCILGYAYLKIKPL